VPYVKESMDKKVKPHGHAMSTNLMVLVFNAGNTATTVNNIN